MSDRSRPQWVKLGRELRRLRIQAGLTQTQLGKRVMLSYGTISGLERGVRGTNPEHLAQLDQALSTEGALSRMWEGMNAFSGLAEWARQVTALQQDATEIRQFSPLLIPGLLQTEEYARAIIRTGRPSSSAEELEERVRARIERQRIFASDRPPLMTTVLDESVLRRPIGGRETMARQIEHLLHMAEAARVTVQIVPLDCTRHPGLDGAFSLFTSPGRGQVAHTETRFESSLIEAPEDVADYARVFEDLRGAALPVEASHELISTALGELR
ncbi:helix-turn-helix transcriptional regulator [Nocardiopsis sp. RSe5-2]|uniref:Helix-turn-helix transcriptional regulator n=1 Tax=Nocardiopsis endophytica TaxID=3018445 RepID=A0ABT4U0X7_9ACTN|nr:helix-turn-helix transcriptional regulator [Nocardiopsis endophytica]MDA2810602.1 helix-turn-helix transcriptional regulator [Nocardiopsis endophytica]